MSVVQMRPTFLLETDRSLADLAECIRTSISDSEEYLGRFAGHHAMIFMDEPQRHFWSPFLHLEIRESEDRREVFGRFSPHPSIWTAFMFSYLVIAVLVFFSAVLGFSQMMLGSLAWAFYLILVELVVALVLWIASKTGQKLAHDEMVEMKQRIEECVDAKDCLSA